MPDDDKNEDQTKDKRPSDSLDILLTDPDVQALLKAKEEGKTFSLDITDGDTKKTKVPVRDTTKVDEDDPAPDFDNMTPADAFRYMNKKLSTSLESLRSNVTDPLQEELKTVKTEQKGQRTRNLQGEVKTVREEFPDFNKHKDEIVKISAQFPSLSIRDMYLLAKGRTGDIKAPETGTDDTNTDMGTDTERPTGALSDIPVKEPIVHGRRAFKALLKGAIDKTAKELKTGA